MLKLKSSIGSISRGATLKVLALIALLISAVPFESKALNSAGGLSLAPGLQLPPSDYSISGARLSLLYGQHRDVYGLDLGLLGNITDQSFTGLALSGLFNITRGTTNVVLMQAAGVTNINANTTNIYGLQLALGANVNVANSKVFGLQVAALNLSNFTDVYGAQIGVYNRALNVYGVQLGLINVAQSLHGIQIGLCNIHQTGWLFVSPILNIGF